MIEFFQMTAIIWAVTWIVTKSEPLEFLRAQLSVEWVSELFNCIVCFSFWGILLAVIPFELLHWKDAALAWMIIHVVNSLEEGGLH